MLHFEVQCETVPTELVAICGSPPLSWDVTQALVLDSKDYPTWRGQAPAPEKQLELKYLIVKRTESCELQLVRWEGDFANRVLLIPDESKMAKLVLRHRFGDVTYESKELVDIEEPGAAKSGGYAEAAAALPIPRRGDQPDEAAQDDSVLGDLGVDPALRLARLVRSDSGCSFSMKYDLQKKVLGTGMSGGVVVGTNRQTGVEVAIKTLPLDEAFNIENIKSEVKHQLTLDHPNICRLLEVFEEPRRLLLVMEKLNGPDLFDALSKMRRYTEKDAKDIVRQIASAVAYCHRNNVCHRDLKLENFCMEDNSENARVKMIDFGLSSSFDESLPMTNSCGTLYYVAPEVIRGKYNQLCDMWSLGVLTYIMLDGRAPFMGRDDRTTYRLILSGKFSFAEDRWRRISQDAKDFVSKLLEVEPTVRMSAEAALKHPWLANTAQDVQDAPTQALDADVLDGLKAFTRGNAAKRALLCALAPVASVDEVSRWADQFEALDEEKTGNIKVSDLMARLVKQGLATEAEAESISEGLKAADSSQMISYSAFLAACLSAHHSTVEDKHIQEIFDKLDKDKKGLVTVEQVGQAFGDVVDIEALESEMGGRDLSFADFQWILQRPPAPSSLAGLRQIIGAFQGLGLAKSWRVDTVLAKASKDSGDQMDAARRENAAWRLWHRQRTKGEAAGPEPSEENPKSPGKKHTLEVGLPVSGSRPPSRPPSRGGLSPHESPAADANASDVKEGSSDDLKSVWAVATAEAKDGDIEAARRENRAWRMMNMEQGAASSAGGSPESK